MSLTKVAPSSSSPTADAAHLRRVVEKQPACLMRVGIDGVILAANDAALALLGAQQPAQVLGGSLATWIAQAHQDAWRHFSRSVSSGISQSVECDLTDISGTQRTVVFHGVPLLDHADGVPSLILGVRDTTAMRHLEASLQESEASRQKLVVEQSQAPMENISGRLQELEVKLEQAEVDREQLKRALSRLPQLEQLLKQGRTHLQDLRTRLDEATKERDRLAARLSEREVSNEQLGIEQAHLQQSLVEQQQHELSELRVQLHEANATRDQMAARLTEREAEYEPLRNEQVRLQQSLETQQQELGLLHTRIVEATTESDQQQQALNALRGEMDQTATERDRLASRLSDTEVTHGQQLADLGARFEEAAADRSRLTHQLQESETYCRQLAADHDTERGRFEDALRGAAVRNSENEKALADQRLELQSLDLAVRSVEPFAAAGRLAMDVARELLTTVTDIDARAACLVAECPADSLSRDEVEQLRADAVRAASMARQILQAHHMIRSEERK